jgi:micrococcal nuclease
MSRAAYLIIPFLVAFCLCAGCSTDTGSPPDTGMSAGQSPSATITGATAGSTTAARATVAGTIDGDTVRLAFPDGRTETLRILGIDTPEVTQEGNDPGKFKGVTDTGLLSLWGEEAASYTHAKLDGQVVTITHDRGAGTRDQYGRLLATLTLPDGTDYGEELLRQGLARVYTLETFAAKERYLAVQDEAMDARVGVWSGHEPVPDGAGQVVIAAVHYNAAGDDSQNLNDEYITIRNSGPTMADLTSWEIRDSDGFVYLLPPVSLSPRESMKLHTGNGTPSAGTLFMGSPVPVLNNEGDTVTLTDREGTMVSSFSWG